MDNLEIPNESEKEEFNSMYENTDVEPVIPAFIVRTDESLTADAANVFQKAVKMSKKSSSQTKTASKQAAILN